MKLSNFQEITQSYFSKRRGGHVCTCKRRLVGNSKYRIANSDARESSKPRERRMKLLLKIAHRKREHASMEIARSRHAIVKHENELASCYFRASQRLPGNSLAITEVLEA